MQLMQHHASSATADIDEHCCKIVKVSSVVSPSPYTEVHSRPFVEVSTATPPPSLFSIPRAAMQAICVPRANPAPIQEISAVGAWTRPRREQKLRHQGSCSKDWAWRQSARAHAPWPPRCGGRAIECKLAAFRRCQVITMKMRTKHTACAWALEVGCLEAQHSHGERNG